MPRPKLVPPDLAGTSSGLEVEGIVWHTAEPGWKGCGRGNAPHVLSLAAQARLAAKSPSVFDGMAVGHYKVDSSLPYWHAPKRTVSDSAPAPYATVIWPGHAWMHEHGWGESDAECTHRFRQGQLDGCSVSNPLPRSYLFDSMFTQARLARYDIVAGLVDRGGPGYLRKYEDVAESNGINITEEVIAIVIKDRQGLLGKVVFPNSGALGKSAMSESELTAFSRYGGRLGTTLYAGNVSFVQTQQAAQCFTVCNYSSECGACVLLSIGTATVAVVPVPTYGQPLHAGRVEAAFHKVHQYSTAYAGRQLPWCDNLTAAWVGRFGPTVAARSGQPARYMLENLLTKGDPPISVLLPGVSPALPRMKLSSARPSDMATIYQLINAGIMQNCSFWDTMGIGYVNKATSNTTVRAKLTTVADVAVPIYIRLDAVDDGPKVDTIDNFGKVLGTKLQDAVAQVVSDAARGLNQATTQELATTDTTKMVLGALWDLSVVVLAIVAMACGRADTELFFGRGLVAFGRLLQR